jgi:hypothetical protein
MEGKKPQISWHITSCKNINMRVLIAMVGTMLGFGKGKMDVQLDKYNYTLGETIRGKVTMKLKKPVYARELRVVLCCEKITRTYRPGHRIGRTYRMGHTHTRVTKIYEFKLPLDGEKEYPQGNYEYPFEIKIPEYVDIPRPSENTVVRVLQFLSGPNMQIKWYIAVSLDVPKGIDVKKRVDINVTLPLRPMPGQI